MSSLEQRAFRIKSIVHSAAIEVGRELAEAKKEIAPYKDGGFQNWVEKKVGYTKAHAYQLINAYDKFKEYDNHTLSDTSMLLLSAPNVPQPAIDEALRRSETEKITVEVTKQIIQQAKKAQKGPKRPKKAQFLGSCRERRTRLGAVRAAEKAEKGRKKQTNVNLSSRRQTKPSGYSRKLLTTSSRLARTYKT